MARPVVLSNGKLFVGLDEHGLVHDFYYPYVGLENLTTARISEHKIGVWVDGQFAWVDDSWQIELDFEEMALISKVRMRSPTLRVTLECSDFVDYEYNALIRTIKVTNDADVERDIRLFMHQVFQISRSGRADTALFVPDDNYILDYKGRCCLLVAGKLNEKIEFDQFAIGNYAIEGKMGTYMDAEDGDLSGNSIEHGGVDSVLRFRSNLAAGDSCTVDYWVVAAESQWDAQVVHTRLKYYSIAARREKTRAFWHNWMERPLLRLKTLPDLQRIMAQKSILIIKAHCDRHGSILASGDSSIFNYGRDYYCYCWPRDAAYALWPLIRLGQYDEAKRFFDFARDTMHRDGYLMHKYQPDRAIGSTWHPLLHGRFKELAIQEDETAIVLFMMGQYYHATHDKDFLRDFYSTFIAPCAMFMSEFVDSSTGLPHASYDLWEQKFLTSTYTICVVIAALETAVEFANATNNPSHAERWQRAASRFRDNLTELYHPEGYFRKGFLLQSDGTTVFDDTVDSSSLYGPFMFAQLAFNDARLQGTLEKVEQRLFNRSPAGGVIRYERDGYFLSKQQYSGNPWLVSTLWLAQYYHLQGKTEQSRNLLDWCMTRRYPSGALSEQFDPETGLSVGVTPLVWSHAELVNTMLDLAKEPPTPTKTADQA